MDLATFCDVWSLKQPELMPFGHISFLVGTPTTPCLPTTSHFCLVSFYSAHDGDSNDILVMYRQNVRPGKQNQHTEESKNEGQNFIAL